jgi:hypothetical protein
MLLIAAGVSCAAVALMVLPVCTPAESAHAAPRSELSANLDPQPHKGLRPRLVIHRKTVAGIERLQTGNVAQSGDVLQISYVAAGHQHGIVLSLDGAGAVTLHHPAQPQGPLASTRLAKRGEHPLPTAFELDDAPGFERFVLITSGDTPTDIEVVVQSARARASSVGARTDPLDLPPGLTQTSVVLRKGS